MTRRLRFAGAVAALWLLAAAVPAAAQRYQAVLTENGRQYPLGTIRLDPSRRIEVLAARPGRADLLRKLAEEVNAEDTLHLDTPPPRGGPRYADTTSPIARTDPRFRDALRAHLRRYYDVTLR